MSTIAIARPVQIRSFAAPAVQLTRRGKIVIVAAVLTAIAVLAIVFGSATVASGGAGEQQQVSSVRVVAGHTLWQIAAEANPNGDIRATVDEIVRLNSLPSASALQLGSTIAVPVY